MPAGILNGFGGDYVGNTPLTFFNKSQQRGNNFYGSRNMPAWMVRAPDASDAVRQRTEDALYNRESARFEPDIERDRRATELRLQQQGIAPGSAAYNTEMERMENNFNDIRERARSNSILTGGAEQSRLFGDELERGNFILGQNRALIDDGNLARQLKSQRRQGLFSGVLGLAGSLFG